MSDGLVTDGLVKEAEWRIKELEDVTLSIDEFYGENWSRINTILTCLQREGHKDWLRLMEEYQERMQAYRSYKEEEEHTFEQPEDEVRYEFQYYNPVNGTWNTSRSYTDLDAAEVQYCYLNPDNVEKGAYRVVKVTVSTEIQSKYGGLMNEEQRKELISLIRDRKMSSEPFKS